MSQTQSRLGSARVKSLSTRRSGAEERPASRIVVRGPPPRPSAPLRRELAHQPGDTLLADTDAVSESELGLDSRGPVDAFRLLMHTPDPNREVDVGELAIARPSPLPRVVALTSHTHDAAQQGDRKLCSLRLDKPKTRPRLVGLPGEESRGALQDLALLAQHLVFPLELTQLRALLRAEHVLAALPDQPDPGATSYATTAPNSQAPERTASVSAPRSVVAAPPQHGTPADTAVSSSA